MVGVGALACLFGARLSRHRPVTLLGHWRQQVDQINRAGLRLQELDGTISHIPPTRGPKAGLQSAGSLEATTEPTDLEPADLLLILVKTPGTAEAAQRTAALLAAGGLVLTLQNGLGQREVLAETFPSEHVAAGITLQAGHLVAPGLLHHASQGPTYLASKPPGTAAMAERLEAVAALFRLAGLPVERVADGRDLQWSKVVLNSAINPLGALLDVTNGELVSSPERRRGLVAIAQETAAIVRTEGVLLPFEDAGERALEVCRATAANFNSMLQDVRRGAATEIDAICGQVVLAARRQGLEAPWNEALWHRVRHLEGRPLEIQERNDGPSRAVAEALASIDELIEERFRSMQVVHTIPELRLHRRRRQGTWGLVPTMGYLHAGHLALVHRARQENDHVAVSLFVNPTQFGDPSDLDHYPRDQERDLELLSEAGTDLVFAPDPAILYPPGFQTYVLVEEVSRPLEGSSRPTHFRGVATVLTKLFHLVSPHRAYFGQKDAQQTVVVRRLVEDLDFDLKIVVCPTVRETDGLAMSSRNARLTAAQRAAAPVVYRALEQAARALREGERDAEALRKGMAATLGEEPLARIDYVSVADPRTLEELETVTGEALLSLAAFFGKIRLIDNLLAPAPEEIHDSSSGAAKV